VKLSRPPMSMRPSLHLEVAFDALEMAIQRPRPARGLIHRSDRGIQDGAEAYCAALVQSGIKPLMSRRDSSKSCHLLRSS
jgi:putative transposase